METITQDRFPQLPDPPISSADVIFEDCYRVSTNDRFLYSLRSLFEESKRIASMRDSCKSGTGDLRGSRTSRQAHEVGYLGELVVSQQLNLTFDREISQTGDQGWDHTFYADLVDITIDTKTTATRTDRPQLIVSAEDTPSADFFVLVHFLPESARAQIVGFIDRPSLIDRTPKQWPSDSSNYIAGWDELYPPRFFDGLVRRQAVLRSRDEGSGPTYCQNCGLILFDNVEQRLYIDDIGQEIGVCPTCAPLLRAAQDQGYVTKFTLYKRPVL